MNTIKMKIKEQPMRVSTKFGSEMKEIRNEVNLSYKEITEEIARSLKFLEIKNDILNRKVNTRKRRAKRI